MTLLSIENLSLRIDATPILRDITCEVAAGETLALVGESGSGKSLTALSVMRLLPSQAVLTGRIVLDGIDIPAASESQMSGIRGAVAGMVFQEPMTALNPLKTIGVQVAEGIRRHFGGTRRSAERAAITMLERVGLASPQVPPDRYPHELSGGQRQRVGIAIACAARPKLLIADEPTTALDVVAQAQIVDLLRELVSERRMALLLISHDLGVVAGTADRIAIMRDGAIVDSGGASEVLAAQAHPYTAQLVQASVHMPVRPPPPAAETPGTPLLQVENLSRNYPLRRFGLFQPKQSFRAVDGVTFSIPQSRSVALVGRSGCGKSTLARMVLALDKPTSGIVRLDGQVLDASDDAGLRAARRKMQVVFQDPYGSFDPRQRVEKLVAEPLHLVPEKLGRQARRERVAFVLDQVGLGADALDRYPHEFSGGQRQRLAIARSLITSPKLIVADEPVSALDVSVRAKILDLFADLQARLGLTLLFITHDLHVARAVADEVLVMDAGRIVERGPTASVLDAPRSEAARALVAAAPDLRKALEHRTVNRMQAGGWGWDAG